jgi:hypothetical protein
MRNVWIALACLIGLATTVAVKFGMSPYASADVSRGLPFSRVEASRESPLTDDTMRLSLENMTAGTNLQNGPSTKADKLEVSHTDEIAPEVKSVKSIAIVLPTTEPKPLSKKIERIASRHWHDPLSASVATHPPTKRKASNKSTDHPRMVSAHAPKS